MCVAAIINKPLSLLDLKRMEESNPHGGGVAWAVPEGMRFAKGLDADEIFALQESGEMTYPYLLHFRWATLGAISPELCHPFPIGIRALLPETEGVAQEVLIHNGTWTPKIPWEERAGIPQAMFTRLSDTAIAAYVAGHRPSVLEHVSWATVHAKGVDGKMEYKKRGSTWSTHEGNEFSNTNWLPYTMRPNYVPYDYGKTSGRDYGYPWYASTRDYGKYKSSTIVKNTDYSVRTKDGKFMTWHEWLDAKYPPVDECTPANEHPWNERCGEEKCAACRFYICTCSPPRPPDLKTMAAEDPDALCDYIESMLGKCASDSDEYDDAIISAMDFMTDEQWQRYIGRRYPDDVVSEDPEDVNDYLERMMA